MFLQRENEASKRKRYHSITNGKAPVDTGRKLNVHKTFRRRPGRLLNVLCTFNLRPVSTGAFVWSISTEGYDQIFGLCNRGSYYSNPILFRGS